MATAVIQDFAGGTAEQYDEVVAGMELGGRTAEHGIFHAAGPYDGGWRVVDVWESAEHFQSFAESDIVPRATAVGLPAPRVQMFEVAESFDQRDGGDGAITLLQIVRLDGMDGDAFADADADIRDNRQPPEGCMFHVNGPTDDGWIVADAWTSKDVRDAFIAGKVAPAMQSRGVQPPTIEDLPIHNTLRSS